MSREGAELAQIGGRPARQAPPYQGRDPVKDALCEWKIVQSQTSTAIPRTRSCKRCAVGMEDSAIHPAYNGICCQTEPANDSNRWTRLNFSIRTHGRPAKMELQ